MDTVTSKPAAAPVDVPAIVRSIPRHRFAAPELHPSAYRAQGPSMSEWQGIPPDRLVTKMVEGLEIDGESRVLEFGADLGFTAAVLGRIADVVYAVRQDAERRAAVRRRLESVGVGNVEVVPAGNYAERLPDEPFDAILVSLVDANPPRSLTDRLVEGGRLVVPREADGDNSRLVQVIRQPDGSIAKKALGKVRYSFLLGDILVDLGAASRDDVEQAAEQGYEEGHPVGQILLEEGVIAEEDLYEALALQHGVEFGHLESLMSRAKPYLLKELSTAWLQHEQILPICRRDGVLEVATVEPEPPTRELLGQLEADELEVHLVGPSDFRRLWEHLKLGELPYWKSAESDESGTPSIPVSDDVYDARLRSLFQTMLRDAVADRASDIHLEQYDQEIRVRFRVDGCLRDVDFYGLTPAKFERLVNIIKVQAEVPITERTGPQSGRFQRRIDEKVYDFRVQTQPTLFGEGVVVRLLPHASQMRSIDGLGFPDRLADRYRRHLDSPSGLVFLAGPTSSGKTTSLYAGLQHYLEEPSRKVITVEDPIEYAVEGIEQTEVDPEIGYTFSNAVRTLVRQDPDVLVLGEIRDEETALQAVRASQTGHLVLATLHANDAVDVVQRLIDLGLGPKSVASELSGIFAQRLARKVCEGCRRQVDPEPRVMRRVFPQGPPEGLVCYDGAGCVRCGGEGTHGRVALVEYLRAGSEVRRAVGRQLLLDELREQARMSGLTTLKESGLRLVREGRIPLSELPRLLNEERLVGE